MRALFRQFSFPGGIPSHVAPETPGSIHEGGELGYALVHAYGAAFDNPDLLVLCVVGDGEAETGPLAASWHSNKFLNPARDGAVLPILHLNGYKIANPTVLARIPRGRAARAARGLRLRAALRRRATTRRRCTRQLAADARRGARRDRRDPARGPRPAASAERPRWPMIVLRTPKGWTGPKEVDGVPVEGTWRAHQVPLAGLRARTPSTCAQLEEWMRTLPARGAVRRRRRAASPSSRALAPAGDAPHEREPARQRRPAAARPARCPTSATTRSTCPRPAPTSSEATRVLGDVPARRHARANPTNFRVFGPDETASNRLGAVFEVTDRAWVAEIAAGRRAPRARRPRDGGALASTSARAGWRATCSPAGTACSTATRRSSTSSTRCSTSTRSG